VHKSDTTAQCTIINRVKNMVCPMQFTTVGFPYDFMSTAHFTLTFKFSSALS